MLEATLPLAKSFATKPLGHGWLRSALARLWNGEYLREVHLGLLNMGVGA